MTNKERLDLARWAVEQAKKQGAGEAAASVGSERAIEVEVRAGKVEKLQEASRNGLTVSLYLDHRYSTHSTNDMRRDALQGFIAEAAAMTRHLAPDPFRALPDPKYYKGQENRELNLVDPGYERVDMAERVRRAKAIEAAALAGGDKIISATAGYYDSSSQNVRVHSNGFEGERSGTSFGISASVTVRDDGGGRPEDYAEGSTRHLKSLPALEAVGKEATNRALRKIGQKKIASGRYDMLVENRAGSRVLNVLISAMSGSSLQQKRSFLDGMLGKQVAHEMLTITEDPFLPAGSNSRLFDSEGLAARKRGVIEKGVLKTYFIDSYYARKMGVEPTTGGASNLVFEPGAKDLPGLVKGVSRGILVTNFIGGNANGTTGDFSLGVAGFYIENGEIRQPLNEMNATGNARQLWMQLAGVGNDPYPYSNWRRPSLHFRDVQFSGL
jgi:PmbA protein